MSSSGNFPDWSVFKERKIALESDVKSPAEELAAVVQQYYELLTESNAQLNLIRMSGIHSLAQFAVYVTQFECALIRYESDFGKTSLQQVYKHFRILKDQMREALQSYGIEIINPLGKSFDEIANVVHVEGWRHHADFTEEVVAEVIEPIVKFENKIVHFGRVIMGSPIKENESGGNLP